MSNRNNNRIEPATHGTGNIFIDAAIEAQQQARDEDGSISTLFLFSVNGKWGMGMEGKLPEIAATLMNFASKDKNLAKILTMAYHGYKLGMDGITSPTKEQRESMLRELQDIEGQTN